MVQRRVWDETKGIDVNGKGIPGAFPYEHYRLVIDGVMNHIIYPTADVASRDLMDAFHEGGTAYILRCIRAYEYTDQYDADGQTIGGALLLKPQAEWL